MTERIVPISLVLFQILLDKLSFVISLISLFPAPSAPRRSVSKAGMSGKTASGQPARRRAAARRLIVTAVRRPSSASRFSMVDLPTCLAPTAITALKASLMRRDQRSGSLRMQFTALLLQAGSGCALFQPEFSSLSTFFPKGNVPTGRHAAARIAAGPRQGGMPHQE